MQKNAIDKIIKIVYMIPKIIQKKADQTLFIYEQENGNVLIIIT